MKISIQQPEDRTECTFLPYALGRRLWIYDESQWYPTVGRWCPHLHIGDGECFDCAMVIETEGE